MMLVLTQSNIPSMSAHARRVGGPEIKAMPVHDTYIGREIVEIPASVASEEQIVLRDVREWDYATSDLELFSWQGVLKRFPIGVIVVAALASFTTAVLAKTMAKMREGLLE